MIFSPSKDDVRRFFCQTWAKHNRQEILTPLETIALDWILEHGEYHELLADESTAVSADFSVEQGQMNPFLHLSMHLAIAEQLSIDQPPGIRSAFEMLARKHQSLHSAAHEVMESLGEVMHHAQIHRQAPDTERYLDNLKRRASR